jgi:hypothetical protein
MDAGPRLTLILNGSGVHHIVAALHEKCHQWSAARPKSMPLNIARTPVPAQQSDFDSLGWPA